jgi:prolyl-tRNA synthetase
MGVIAEVFADEKGLVWPEGVAPFKYHLVAITGGDTHDAVMAAAEKTYATLKEKGIEVLFDDRDLRAGEKFADSDLMGIPTRIVVGKKSVESGTLELVDRKTGIVTHKRLEELAI